MNGARFLVQVRRVDSVRLRNGRSRAVWSRWQTVVARESFEAAELGARSILSQSAALLLVRVTLHGLTLWIGDGLGNTEDTRARRRRGREGQAR